MNTLYIHNVTSATHYRRSNEITGDGSLVWTEVLVTVKDGPSFTIVLLPPEGASGDVFEVA